MSKIGMYEKGSFISAIKFFVILIFFLINYAELTNQNWPFSTVNVMQQTSNVVAVVDAWVVRI